MKGRILRKNPNEFADFFHQIERLNKDRKPSRQDACAPFIPRHLQPSHPLLQPDQDPINNPKISGNQQSFNSKTRALNEAFDSGKQSIACLSDFKFLEDKLQYKGNIPQKVQLLQEIMLSDEPLVSVEEV